jgi:uncharacterized protein (DUF433 family)
MSITFQNPAQQLIYERARVALAQMPGVSIAKHASEPSLRVSRAEHQAHVYIHPHGDLEAIIRVGTLVASGAQPDAAPLLRYLLEQNNNHPLGAFCLDPDGHIILEHSAVASAFDGPALCATVDAILTTLAQTQGLIMGYISRTAELAAEDPAPAAAAPAKAAPAPAAPPVPAAAAPAKAAPARAFAAAAAAAQAKPARLWLDDMGLYHCVRGLPIAVVDVLELVEAGQTDAQIIAQYPDLTAEDISEVCAFGPSIREAERPPAPAEPEPEPEPEPLSKRIAHSPSKTPRRLRLDDLGMFYCVRDLPISVDELLDLLDAGKTDAQIFADYPDLTPEDLDEVKRFGPPLRQPKEEAPPEPLAPVIPPAPAPTASAIAAAAAKAPPADAAPPQPKRRTLKRIRLDDLGIYYCIRGLPISVDEVIARLDGGATEAEVLREFPALDHEDVEEVLWYRDKMRQAE